MRPLALVFELVLNLIFVKIYNMAAKIRTYDIDGFY